MPISPLEIQKGSIVCFEGKPSIVKSIGDFIMLEGRKEWIGGSLMNGEPISEVWLERFNFLKEDGEFFRQFDLVNWGIRVKKDEHSDGWIVFQGFMNKGAEIRLIHYIHELQLIFFATSGEHLQLPKTKSK